MSEITSLQREALISGATILVDELFDDLVAVEGGKAIKDTSALSWCLPPQYRNLYTPLLIKRFIICTSRVMDCLPFWQEGCIPMCSAESLALKAIISEAVSYLEMICRDCEDFTPDDLDFSTFEDIAFPDMDIELLFDASMNGIENSEIAEQMGMHIRWEDWFKPIYGSVHPFVRD